MSDTFTPDPAAEEAPQIENTLPSAEAEPAAQGEPEAPPPSATADEPGADHKPDETPAWAKKRFGELTAKLREAERRAEMAELAARGAHQQPQPHQAQPQGAPQLPPDLAQWVGAEPKASDFPAGEFDPAFIRAAARYDIKVDQAQQALSQRQQQVQRANAEFGQKVATVMEATVKASPDVAEVLSDPSFPMPQHVVREIVDLDKPDAVLAHLAKNPQEAARIAGLRGNAVARELGRIEARLSYAPPPPVTSAPPPPRAVRGAGSSAAFDPNKASMEEYAAWRRKGGD